MTPYCSIVVPLYNEEACVESLLNRIRESGETWNVPFEIIFVDDGSTDRTWPIIERLKKNAPELKAIKFRRNYGQTCAMVAGFELASGEIIVTMDGDLQNDPADISRLIDKLQEGWDIVSGWRKNRKDSRWRVFPSRIANKIISWTTGVRLHDYGCSLKAYRAVCVKSLKAYGEMHRFLPALARMTGARVTEIPVSHHPRRFGVSKYGFDRIFKVFSDIFAMNLIIRFASNPLKGFVFCAIPFVLLALFFIGLSVLAVLFQWTSGKALFFMIGAALNITAAIHLTTLGVLGELVVGMSDLSHTQMPEVTKRRIPHTVEVKEDMEPESENIAWMRQPLSK
ncbi:MAG: glycosyltransferase family 2 protein [Desulfobacterales bacterium]